MEWQVIVCVSMSIEEKIKGNKKKKSTFLSCNIQISIKYYAQEK